ncbi:tyrosine-type recombinase/integrase [Streptosporangium sp. CA-135522]|uniref:tyrosine-type recombinase/integrase n=1 Tax=Streptosporangium sp. CA-135522 TaxID=3240072 RepID=UPI003D94F96A
MKRHREQQHAEQDGAGADWQGSGYVFTTPQGRPIDPTNLIWTFTTLLRKAGLRRIRFHDLRHSTAPLLLDQSVELVIIKELLGHAHIGVTATVYAHVRLRLQRDAIDTLSTALDSPTDDESTRDDGGDPAIVRSHRPLTLPSATAVTHRRSPARTHLAGLQFCVRDLPVRMPQSYDLTTQRTSHKDHGHARNQRKRPAWPRKVEYC